MGMSIYIYIDIYLGLKYQRFYSESFVRTLGNISRKQQLKIYQEIIYEQYYHCFPIAKLESRDSTNCECGKMTWEARGKPRIKEGGLKSIETCQTWQTYCSIWE